MSWNQDAKCGIYIYECTPINIDTMRYIYASLSNEYFLEDEGYRKLLQKRIEVYVDKYYLERICSSGCSERSGCSRCSGRSENSGCLEYLASSQYSDCYEDSECSDARSAILVVCDA